LRVRKIEIARWRNFENVSISLADNTSLVCLVGSNGTGKTHILELISACAHHIGLSAGINIPRGNPFEDTDHDFSLEVFLARGVSTALDATFGEAADHVAWDRTLRVTSRRLANESHSTATVSAGGITDPGRSQRFARLAVERLGQSRDVHLVTLDADRAYPKKDLPAHEMAQAFETQWEDWSFTKGRSFMPSRALYDEWIKYCLAKENKAANKFYQEARRAAEENRAAPGFTDAFATYRESLREVMPHLLFAGADQEKKTILFDTSGMELRFDQLSGGEREIAFLTGQIDRFGLKNGIFLLDEPELHLNPDLVRSWVTYLSSTVQTGQVWLATHSLEAVEAAGQSATILLERNSETKKVDKVSSLTEHPVLSALSRAVGTPAFSITALRFVFIEGEEAIGERERYRRICATGPDTRFIECGDCKEVERRVNSIRAVSRAATQPIRITGVIDRDWRGDAELRTFKDQVGVLVLRVHEIENFFLHPGTVNGLAVQNGLTNFNYEERLVAACDARAGGWIIQSTLSRADAIEFSQLPAECRALAHALTWDRIATDIDGALEPISGMSGFVDEKKAKLKHRLNVFARIYERKRASENLWKVCEGKEICKVIARDLGFSDATALEKAAVTFWNSAPNKVPTEVQQLRGELEAV
jgi:predicted ATPase